jgi:hypothetical protein
MNATFLDVVRMLFVLTLLEATIADASKNSEGILSLNVLRINHRLRTYVQRSSVALMQFVLPVSASVKRDFLEMPMTLEMDANLLPATTILTAATMKSV